VEDYILHLKRRDGGPVAMSVNAQMVLDGDGQPVRIDGVFRDVSERIRMERQLQSYAEDMEKKNEELESLIYSITHDFKSPLLVVGGLVGRLTKTASTLLDSKRKEYLDWMQLNVSKMDKMVNDLLVFYRADKTLVPFEPVSIGSVVDTVIRDVEPLSKEKENRLRKKGSFPVVNGYRNRLYQVFYNLVENAIKYMDHAANAQVEIGCKINSDEHLFYVKDNGPGIAPEHLEKIFQIFYTLEPERVSGTGIGLSIVKKIIEKHGGRVWVESELGKGTTFCLALPVTGTI
jgi:signal transduction histidine kinase